MSRTRKPRVSVVWFSLAMFFVLLLPFYAKGQAASASLNGTVTDASGATIPNATVKLQNTQTGTTYSAQTASDGGYRFSDLPPGPGYALTITKSGFQTLVLNGLYLPTATATTKDAQLSLGQVSQTVEVTANTGAVTLDTTDATIGSAIDMNAVENLPDEFRDNPSALLRLEVGVTNAETTTGNAITSNIDPNHTRDGSVAGARADQNNIIVDGIDASDFATGAAFTTDAAVPVDAIQEFNTEVAEPSAGYGGRSGAQTIITTKSGSNDWHGSAYEYNRTAATEANTFFNLQAGVPRLALVRNQFGANVGGPVKKDKLFFFFEYDGRRDASAESELQFVPYPHVKNGEIAYINNSSSGSCSDTSSLTSLDVSTDCVTIAPASEVASFDPCTSDPGACSSAYGFVQGGIAPVIQNLFTSRYPAPNDYTVGDGLNIAGLRFNAPSPLTENGYIARVDYNVGTNNKLFGMVDVKNENTVNNTVGVSPIQFPGDSITALENETQRAWVLGDTWTIGPNLVNQFTYGETRENLQEPVNAPQAGNLYELSFFGAFEGSTFATPYDRQTSQGRVVPDPTFRDDITWTHGTHTFQFGAEFNPAKVRSFLTNDFAFVQEGLGGAVPNLSPSFRPADIKATELNGEGQTVPDSTVLDNWDNFFMGDLGIIWNYQVAVNYTGSGTALPLGSAATRDWRINNVAGYFQDAWRARPDLTVSYGVRYQFQEPPYEVHGTEAQFFNTNVNQIVNTRVQNGVLGIASAGSTPELIYQKAGRANSEPPLYSPERYDFSPRLSFAWNPSFSGGLLGKAFGDHKTVIRAGGALLFDQSVIYAITNYEDQSNYLFGNTISGEPNSGNPDLTNVLETDPRMNSVTTLPIPITPPPFQTPLVPAAIFNDGIDPNLRTPYSVTASFGLQRELPAGFQFEADYYGRFGRRLMLLADTSQAINFVDPASGQSLVSAFTALENDAASALPVASVETQPFIEDEVSAGFGGTCAAYAAKVNAANNLSPGTLTNCTQAVYYANSPALSQGGTGGILTSIPLPPNVGLTPQFYVDAIMANKGFSDYNGLFVILRKRLSNNLQFDFNYTFSHSIDNGSTVSNEDGNFESGDTSVMCDATNNRACRGNSEFDLTHQVSANFVYSLPIGHGQLIGGNVNALLNEAIGGWQVSGIGSWHSGFAYTVNDTDFAAFDTVSLAADTGMLFTGSRGPLQAHIHVDPAENNAVQFYADPATAAAQFSPVTGLESGDRDNLRGPGFSDLDLEVSKTFPLPNERFRLKLVADAYNVFNHPNFGLPDTGATGSSFGVIRGLIGEEPSRVMQFALRFDF
ncbi:MAG TPA: TonB-dependent receptor [Candidatus Aquilonibacter sp.]|nr:TonB-dependent receptor [Candidatus Aquilonibacter sp.]